MNIVRLLPVFLSALLIAAHFYRSGLTAVAIICLFAPGVLFIRKPWSVRIIQIFLILCAAEWFRTVVNLAQLRLEHGMPWIRLTLILGGVTLFTVASTLVFRHPQLQKRYKFR